jgi:flagellar biosynthetic protein FliQ
MTFEYAVEFARETLWTLFVIAAPIVLGALIVGFLIGLFQSLTQVREATLSFVPKIVAVGAIVWIMAPYIVRQLIEYSTVVFILIEEVGL